jgi:4,5-dihydroxyphthalate decarboxylase
MRGWMQNDVGMDMSKIKWVQAGANAPGREEKVELNLPDGIEITRVKDKSLSEMLVSGDLDCAIIARPPTCFLEDHPDIVRLFPNFLELEEQQFAGTGVWPIMHIIAMKKSIHDAHPWVARNMFNAFEESKRRSLKRLLDPAVSRYPLAWLSSYGRKMQGVFGKDPFPFGVEPNRKTWEMMGLYSFQQGIAHRQFEPEDIFPASVTTKVVI